MRRPQRQWLLGVVKSPPTRTWDKSGEVLCRALVLPHHKWKHSSAEEHLPVEQGVAGSSPVASAKPGRTTGSTTKYLCE